MVSVHSDEKEISFIDFSKNVKVPTSSGPETNCGTRPDLQMKGTLQDNSLVHECFMPMGK